MNLAASYTTGDVARDVSRAESLRRAPLARAEQAANVAWLLGAHVALVLFWCCVSYFAARVHGGAWLLCAAPLACLLHQKAISEWMHEAAHHNFLASRVRNDRFIQWLAAVCMFEEIGNHRRQHFRHHATPGFFMPDDPETELLAVRTRRDFRRGLWEDLLGVTALRAVSARRTAPAKGGKPAPAEHKKREHRAVMVSVFLYLSVGVSLAFTGGIAALAVPAYLLTLLTLYPAFNRIRVSTQHIGLGEAGAVVIGSTTSRTTHPAGAAAFFDRCFLNSHVMLFHAEHHRHPTLPFRQLERLFGRNDDPNRFSRSRVALLRLLYVSMPP